MTLQKVKEEAMERFEEISKILIDVKQDYEYGEIKTYMGGVTPDQFDCLDSIITKAYEDGINLILSNIQAKLEEEKKQSAYNKNIHIRSILGGLEDEILQIKENLK